MPPLCDASATGPLHVVGRGERGAHVPGRVVDAVDVRPDEADAVLARRVDELLLELGLPGLGEAGRDHDRGADALVADLRDRVDDELGRDREDRDVDAVRQVGDVGVDLLAEDLLRLRVDRVDLALEAAVDEVLHHRVADLALLLGGADHGDGPRVHQLVHRLEDLFLAVARRPLVGGVEVHDEARVDRDRAVLLREHRVEIDLGDLREVGHQLRDPLDHAGERVLVDARPAAHAAQHLGRADPVDHRARVVAGRRREPERHVAQDLDEDPAEAERDDGPERGIADGADQDLLALGQHLLDLHAGDVGVGLVGLGVLHDRVVAGAHLVGRSQPDQHALGLRLVEDVGRDDLGDDGIPDLVGGRRRPPPRWWRALRPAPRSRRRRRPAWPRARSGPRGRRRVRRRAPPGPSPGRASSCFSYRSPSSSGSSLPCRAVEIARRRRRPRSAARDRRRRRRAARAGSRRCARRAAASASRPRASRTA